MAQGARHAGAPRARPTHRQPPPTCDSRLWCQLCVVLFGTTNTRMMPNKIPKDEIEEPSPSTEEHPVLDQLQRAGRDARWHMSRHTLELAISAIEPPDDETGRPQPSAKSRRRKKRKRFL